MQQLRNELRKLLQTYKVLLNGRHLSTKTVNYQRTTNILKKIDPYSKIRIQCSCKLTIAPYNLHDCPDSNLLKATFTSADLAPTIHIEGKDVFIRTDCSRLHPEGCTLEVPIKADLQIANGGSTMISDLYSDEIRVESSGNILTKSLRSTVIDLKSSDGNISCDGTTLAQNIRVKTTGKGNIMLHKLQGEKLEAESNCGHICVNSSYSNNASFKTQRGDLLLKSIHKFCLVASEGPGRFVMNGFYGTLQADVSSREVSLQLSEIVGKCTVNAKSAEMFSLAISDTLTENTEISIQCGQFEVDSNLANMDSSELGKGGLISLGNKSAENKLLVRSGGLLTLKKMSWADTFAFITK